MAKKFPRFLFVKIEQDGDTHYFAAHDDAACLVEMGDAVILAKYELPDTMLARGIAQFNKPLRR